MFIKSFVSAGRASPRARHGAWRARLVGCAAGVHALVAAPAASGPRVRRVRAIAAHYFTRVAALAARTAMRAAWAGRPLTPGGYAIAALTVAGIVLAVLISMSPAGDELDSALPLCWWFA
jgi:hypothetical protein